MSKFLTVLPLRGHRLLTCQDEIVDSYNGRQAEIHKIKCQYPYRCDLAYAPVECVRNEGPAPESFFGQKSMETSPGVHLFPEFAWTLDNEMVIRDGRELYPAQDYIDNSSVELFFYIAFYVPTSRVRRPPVAHLFAHHQADFVFRAEVFRTVNRA